MAPKGENSMQETEENLELAESLSGDSTHNFDVIDLDAVDFQPFLTNRSGVALNYHSSDHPEHKLLVRESFSNDHNEEVAHGRMTAYALLLHSCLERRQSTNPTENEQQGLPRRYVTWFGVITFICFVAISHIMNATRFLSTLVQKSGLQENLSLHAAIPREDAYRDYDDLPLETLDTPVYWDVGARAKNMSTSIISTTCFTRASDSRAGHGSSINVVVTQHLWEAANLFNTTHRGRLFSMFRNPIERLVSDYLMSQKANERLTFKEFLSSVPSNYLVRSLVNRMEGPVNEDHLSTAKALVKGKFLIGLFEEQTESLRRIESYFGWKRLPSKVCRKSFLGNELQKERPHTKIDSNDMQKRLTKANHLDLELYDFIKLCFQEQMALFKH